MSLLDWFTNATGISGSPSMANTDWSNMAAAGYTVPGMAGDTGSYNNVTNPTNWSGLSSALKGLSSDTGTSGTGTGTGTSSNTQSAATSQARSALGTPAAPVSMNELVKLLQAKSQMYMQQAVNPQTSGTPVQSQRYSGLLGF